jgi:hypothetical protein
MRSVLVMAAAVLLSLTAVARPAPAGPIVTVGSHVGLECYSREGDAVFSLSTSPPGLLTLSGPGLRVGLVLPDGNVELAAGIDANVIGSSGDLFRSLGFTLEGQYLLPGWSADVDPYVGAHVGLANSGFEGCSESFARYGLQIGVRRMVAAGHGDVRLELRGGLIQGPFGEAVSEVGVRLGYDLWLR